MRKSRMKTTTIDGRLFTTDDVIDKVGCARSTATKRIKNAKTIDELLGPIAVNKIRKFTIENTTFTVREVMNKLDCSGGTAYHRLMKSNTLDALFGPIGVSEDRNPHNEKMTDMNNSLNRLLYGKW